MDSHEHRPQSPSKKKVTFETAPANGWAHSVCSKVSFVATFVGIIWQRNALLFIFQRLSKGALGNLIPQWLCDSRGRFLGSSAMLAGLGSSYLALRRAGRSHDGDRTAYWSAKAEWLRRYIGAQTERMHAAVQQRLETKLNYVMDQVGEKAKDEMKDDYMPRILQSIIDDTIDNLMPDIKLSVLNQADEFLQTKSPMLRLRQNPKSGGSNGVEDATQRVEIALPAPAEKDRNSTLDQRWARCLRRCRARVLYNCSPYDQSIWWSIRNPRWIMFTCIGMLPTSMFGPVAVVWWLLLFLIRDKRDEFQLCDFIIGVQSAKFVSQGLFGLGYGAFLYFMCANRLQNTCAEKGPQIAYVLDIAVFFLQIVLVWLAFALLPYSQRKGGRRRWTVVDANYLSERLGSRIPMAEIEAPRNGRHLLLRRDARALFGCLPGLHGTEVPKELVTELENDDHQEELPPTLSESEAVSLRVGSGFRYYYDLRRHEQQIRSYYRRGGHLMRLFWFDTVIVSLVVGTSIVVWFGPIRLQDWQVKATLYWIRTLYGLVSFPFVLFKLPLMGGLLTRAQATGYDSRGRTVLMKVDKHPLARKGGDPHEALAEDEDEEEEEDEEQMYEEKEDDVVPTWSE